MEQIPHQRVSLLGLLPDKEKLSKAYSPGIDGDVKRVGFVEQPPCLVFATIFFDLL